MGRVPTDCNGAVRLSPLGDTALGRTDATSEPGRNLKLTSPWGGDGGGGDAGNQNLCHPSPEHCHTIYCNKANYGPVSGDREAYGVAGFEVVVGAREH